MQDVYFSSDWHLFHKNIIEFSKRPFSSVEEMNEVLIENWNERVKKNDTAYFIGDFSFGSKQQTSDAIDRLNGQIHFIRGNHDKITDSLKDKFVTYSDYKKIKVNDQSIILCHYAFRVFDGSHRGAWNLYGHSHGSLPDDSHALAIDVGVDCHNFYPVSFDEVAAIMETKSYKPIDHHGRGK